MNSPLVLLQQTQQNSGSVVDLRSQSKLCLTLGRVHQSIVLAHTAVQADAQQSLYQSHYVQSVRLGAEFAEEVADHPKAAFYWEQLTQQIPQDAGAWYGFGLAKANLQDYRGASEALERALQLDPSNQKVRSHLAEVQTILQG